MTVVSNQSNGQDAASRDEWESEGGATFPDRSMQEEERAQRWQDAKDVHWHSVDYTEPTQARSHAEPHR